MRENRYQKIIIDTITNMLPGCIILKNDPTYLQGVPDLVIFYGDRYAMLEVKASAEAEEQPNQGYYVERFDEMSFAAFIYPENEVEVLLALQHSLTNRG